MSVLDDEIEKATRKLASLDWEVMDGAQLYVMDEAIEIFVSAGATDAQAALLSGCLSLGIMMVARQHVKKDGG